MELLREKVLVEGILAINCSRAAEEGFWHGAWIGFEECLSCDCEP